MLRCAKTVFLDVWDEVLELVDEEARNSDQARDADRDEAKSCLAKVEVVNWWINQSW